MITAVGELLIDATRRKMVAILLAMSALIIGGISYGLQLEVVDGAIASARVFGQIVGQGDDDELNLSGLLTAIRMTWFVSISFICLILASGTISDWSKDSYSVFLLQAGLSRFQVYFGVLTATWILLGAFVSITTLSLEFLLESKLGIEIAGLTQAGFAAWTHLLSVLCIWYALIPRSAQWLGTLCIGGGILILGYIPLEATLSERSFTMNLFSILPSGEHWIRWLLADNVAIDAVPRLHRIDFWGMWALHLIGWTCIGTTRMLNREFSDRDE